MFKKNCCPGCGAVTGYMAGETCSAECKRDVDIDVRGLKSRERVVPWIDAIDAESQQLATRKPDAWAFLLTIATDLRVLKQRILKLPYDQIPDDLFAEVQAKRKEYAKQRDSLHRAYGKKPKPEEVLPDEGWRDIRPLTDFERKARGGGCAGMIVGVDFGVCDDPGQTMAVTVKKREDGKLEITDVKPVEVPLNIKMDFREEDPSRVAKIFKESVRKAVGKPTISPFEETLNKVTWSQYQSSLTIPRSQFEQMLSPFEKGLKDAEERELKMDRKVRLILERMEDDFMRGRASGQAAILHALQEISANVHNLRSQGSALASRVVIRVTLPNNKWFDYECVPTRAVIHAKDEIWANFHVKLKEAHLKALNAGEWPTKYEDPPEPMPAMPDENLVYHREFHGDFQEGMFAAYPGGISPH